MEKIRRVACGGHWVVDRVRVIDRYPRENGICRILKEDRGSGGCAFNTILDLATLDSTLPLVAVGLIGADPEGDFVMERCRRHPNIDLALLKRMSEERTGYTDAYISEESGERTFFSFEGANRRFSSKTIDLDSLEVDLFHFGYLTLLSELDREDPEFGRAGARFLARLKEGGMMTSMDLVSSQSPEFASIVLPTLPYVDLLFMNDFEAEQLSGIRLREKGLPSLRSLRRICHRLFQAGVGRYLVIHFPEGSFIASREGEEWIQPALQIPPEEIAGTPGAGDAFAAGLLFSLIRGFSLPETLRFATCAGAACLFDVTTTGGMLPWQEVRKFEEKYAYRETSESFVE